MERDFNKIVIVSLCDEKTCDVAKKLSQTLGMMFCDAKELLKYELVDADALKKICTKEYLDRAEKMVFRRIASFVDVIVAIDFDAFVHNFKTLKKNSLLVFLNFPKSQIGDAINLVAYDSRKKELENLCTVEINIRKADDGHVCEKIIKVLGGIV